jgi:Reverse transcriptase (RNA-dependent DNA polymerase)/GAG-pre-integrase domain/Integrase core domain/gag-polypeptide of LTR copia-type
MTGEEIQQLQEQLRQAEQERIRLEQEVNNLRVNQGNGGSGSGSGSAEGSNAVDTGVFSVEEILMMQAAMKDGGVVMLNAEGSNIPTWRMNLCNNLELLNLLYAIEQPNAVEGDPGWKEPTMKHKLMVKRLLVTTVHEKYKHIVQESETPFKAMTRVCETVFGSISVSTPKLLTSLWTIKFREGEKVADFIERIRDLVRQLSWLKKKVGNDELRTVMVNALKDRADYRNAREKIVAANDMDLDKMRRILELKESLLQMDSKIGGSNGGAKSTQGSEDLGSALHIRGYENRDANAYGGGGAYRGGHQGQGEYRGRGRGPRGRGGYPGRGRGGYENRDSRNGDQSGTREGVPRGGVQKHRGGPRGNARARSSREHITCYNCGGRKHFSDECKKPCGICGLYNHKAPNCHHKDKGGKTVGKASMASGMDMDPPSEENPDTEERGTAYMTQGGDVLMGETGKRSTKHEWIYDSGADHHMTPCREILFNYRKAPGIVQVAANGITIKREGIGSMRVIAQLPDGTLNRLIIHDVWYVPDLVRGLLSSYVLTEKGYWPRYEKATRSITLCSAQDDPMIHFQHHNGLYWPNWIVQIPSEQVSSVKQNYSNSVVKGEAHASRAIRSDIPSDKTEVVQLWHQRLGHLSYDTLAHLVKDNLITGVNLSYQDVMNAKQTDVCEPCIMAKFQNAGFGEWTYRATKPCETVHADIIELDVPSLGGNKYAVMLLDDHSDRCDGIPLKTKAQAKFEMQRVLNEWETKSGHKVKRLYTDRGGEFLNDIMKEWCARKGIIHEKSPAYVHQLNGRAENLNKRFVNRLRAMLYTYLNVPKDIVMALWAEGMKYLSHLHNVSLNKRLNSTPLQAFEGIVPDVSKLRTFGCRVYYRIPDELRKKLQPKAEPGIYLGPSYDGPGVRVLIYHPELKQRKWQVKVVRDVFALESLTRNYGVQNYELQESGPGPLVIQGGSTNLQGHGQESREAEEWPLPQVTPGMNPFLLEYRPNPQGGEKTNVAQGRNGEEGTSGAGHSNQSARADTRATPYDGPRARMGDTRQGIPNAGGTRSEAQGQPSDSSAQGAAKLDTHEGGLPHGIDSDPSDTLMTTGHDPTPASGDGQVDDEDDEPPGLGDPDDTGGEQLEAAQRYPKRQRKVPEVFGQNAGDFVPRKGTYSELYANIGKAHVAVCSGPFHGDEDESGDEEFFKVPQPEQRWEPEFIHGRKSSKSSVSLLNKVAQSQSSAQDPKPVTQWSKVDPDRDTPTTYTCALLSQYRDEWIEALIEEYKSLVANTTWHLVPKSQVPADKKVIPSKWVFKIKTDQDNYPSRFKCRLVAGGHKQTYGEDYDLTYAPVSRITTLRTMLSVAAYRGWKVHQVDIKTAFLHGDIDTDVYMEQPEGFVDDADMVCKLDKCLYGLKQAPRAWYLKLTEFLAKELNFDASELDSSLWIKQCKDGKVYLSMVVDDLALTGPVEHQTMLMIKRILLQFPGTHAGIMNWYIGMKVTWLPGEHAVMLTQTAHVENILKRFEGKGDFMKPLDLPMKDSLRLFKSGSNEHPMSPILDTTKYPYRSLVGALNYLSCSTRPDIAYTVNTLSKFLNEPRVEHWNVAINLLRYLKKTKDWGLKLGGGDEGATCYCDASYGSYTDPTSGDACVRATTGSVFLVNGGTVHWKSGTQEYASRSTTDAEYRACCDATCDSMWLMELLRDFDMDCRPFVIHNDSQGALCAICNQNITQRTKHIARQVGFVRDYYKRAMVTFKRVEGKDNLSDVLTKPLGGNKHYKFIKGMGMCQLVDKK